MNRSAFRPFLPICFHVHAVRRELPFVTVVTDLGGAHPTWFNDQADKVFIASDAVMRVAFREGLNPKQVSNHSDILDGSSLSGSLNE